MSGVDNNFKRADTVVLKLSNHEGVNEFRLNKKHSAPGMIPYIHVDPLSTTICFSWKMNKPCYETYIFIEKEPPASPSSRAREKIIKFIEHLPADGIFRYLFTNLPPGKTFRFRIKAFNSVGQEGPFSRWVETSTLYLTPEPPGLHCIEWSTDSLTLSWQNPPVPKEDILHYIVEMQTSIGTFRKIYEGPKLKLKVNRLKADTAYHFRICAFDQSRERKGSFSTPYIFSTCFRLIEGRGSNLFVKAIELRKYNKEHPQHCQEILSTMLPPRNMRPSYKYERKDAMQNFEEMVRFALSPVPSAINKVNIYSWIDSFYLSWTEPTFNSLSIRNYNIELQASNNVVRYLLNTNENVQQVLLKDLDYGTTYNIRIQAVNEFGAGYFTHTLQVATLQKIPQPPELKCKKSGETFLELVWDVENRNGVLSYTVELQEERGFFTVYQGPSYSCILDMLTPNTEYFLRISAFCAAGRSDYSKSYCFKTISLLYKAEIYGCESSDEDTKDSEKQVVRATGEVDPSARQFSEFKFTYHPHTEKWGIDLCYNDVRTLNPSTFLNDTIIEFYLKYLYCERLTEVERDKIHIFSSFFFSKLIECANSSYHLSENEILRRQHNAVKTFTRRCDLFSKDFLIIPINQAFHWMVAIICFPGLAPDVCDSDAEHYNLNDENTASFFNGNSKTEKRSPCICIFNSMHSFHSKIYATKLREYLDSEWTVRKGTKKIFNKYTMPDYCVNCPQQPNGFDCGIFMLQNVETFFEKQIPYFEEDFLDMKSWFSIGETVLWKRQEIKNLLLKMQKKVSPFLPPPF